jgi:ankyrin repeat protein
MALFHAVDTNNIEEVQRLILEGNHLDELNGSFHRAVMRENLEMCKILLAAGADVNIRTSLYLSCLEQAAYARNVQIYRLLVQNGARMTYRKTFSPLEWAVYYNDIEMCKLIFDYGCNINHVNLAIWITITKHTDTAICRMLLEKGLKPDGPTDIHKQTPLMWAAIFDNLEMCKILLAAGADINKKSAYNETAYDIAVRHNNARISDFLKYHTLK